MYIKDPIKSQVKLKNDDIRNHTQTKIFNNNGCYSKHTEKGIKDISNFMILIKELILSDYEIKVKADFISEKGYKVEKIFSINALNSRRSFLEVANDIYFSFTGTDNDLQEIKKLISLHDFYERKGVMNIGFYNIDNRNLFITNTHVIDSKLNTVDNVVITEDKIAIKTDILKIDEISKDELKIISPFLFKFNKLEIAASILGTLATFMIKERLKQFNIKTQHLMLFGEAGSGKSQTLENIISPFFSYESNILSCTGVTRFTSVKNISSSNTIPLLLEEYKPSEMNDRQRDMLVELFRNIYDEHSEQRGNRNQTITDYPLLSPIVVVGEEQIDQTEVVERSIITSFSKLESTRNNREENYIALKNNRDLIQKLGRSILNIAIKIEDKELLELINKSRICTKELFKGRVKQNVNNTIVGIYLIIKMYEQLGLNIEDETQVKVSDIISSINNNVFLENLEGSANTKTITDNTLEVIDLAVGKEFIKEGIHYSYINNKTELALLPNTFYSDITKFKKDYAIETNIIATSKQFTKMLKTTDYYVSYKNAKYIDENNRTVTKDRKSHVLNVDKLKYKGLEMDNLLS